MPTHRIIPLVIYIVHSRVWNKRTPLNKRSLLENLAKRIIVAPFLPYTMKSGIRTQPLEKSQKINNRRATFIPDSRVGNRSCMIRNTLSCQGFLLQRLIAADLILLFFLSLEKSPNEPPTLFSPKDFFFSILITYYLLTYLYLDAYMIKYLLTRITTLINLIHGFVQVSNQ